MQTWPTATAATAALLTILNALLISYLGAGRFKFKVTLGDGGVEAMNRRVRMHGNLMENAPLFLILLALVEMAGDHGRLAWIVGLIFVVLRIFHAVGLSTLFIGPNPVRAIGAGGSLLCQLILAGTLLPRIL